MGCLILLCGTVVSEQESECVFMNSKQQPGEFQAAPNNGTFSQQQHSLPRRTEMDSGALEEQTELNEGREITQGTKISAMEQGNIAYELLLLQQRLVAYEQLHTEEMAELRQEIERLRRAFLQETNPQVRILSSSGNLYIQK